MLRYCGNQVWKFAADGTVQSVAVDSSGNVYAGTDGEHAYKLTPEGSNTTTWVSLREALQGQTPYCQNNVKVLRIILQQVPRGQLYFSPLIMTF